MKVAALVLALATTISGCGNSASENQYRTCAEVRQAGMAPIREGDPGWSSRLDRNNDGVACE